MSLQSCNQARGKLLWFDPISSLAYQSSTRMLETVLTKQQLHAVASIKNHHKYLTVSISTQIKGLLS